jgi:hypothetical protein
VSEEITIKAFSIERTEFKVDSDEYARDKANEELDQALDVHLSDMQDSETVLVEPDGTVVNPYGRGTDLLKMLEPILAEIPTWMVEQYVAGRRSEEE